MMTGNPLDLTPFGGLLGAVGALYWLLALGLVGLALWLPKRVRSKLATAVLVAAVFTYPVMRNSGTKTQQAHDAQVQLATAMALFGERCEAAGEKIYRVVENVDGVVWLKWREKISNADNFADQWKLNDPYGQDCGEEDCIRNLLRLTEGAALNPERAKLHSAGYRYVETVDPRDGLWYRYSAHLAHGWTREQVDRHKSETGKDVPPFSYHFTINRIPIDRPMAHYGIAWEDISTQEDRQNWIAGGSLRVIAMQTNEVIAERTGYMIDRGQGSQIGGRSPWAFARDSACPAYRSATDGRAYFDPVSAQFAQRVLRPSTGKD